MALISEFIDDYKGKIGHYEHLAQTCACQCESALKRQGIRALVTSRAKKLDSLASKVETRAKEKAYQSIEEIYDDIVDLAGVRVALYFPGDREEVDHFIRSHFNVDHVKDFPEALQHP
ncbi:MAG TPA: RelA/SpoT protein, partial [Firmicutes bacterium]|nr:RelA/SpoT protein [Bacillota bacterium]